MTNSDPDNSQEWAAQAYALLKKRQEEKKQDIHNSLKNELDLRDKFLGINKLKKPHQPVPYIFKSREGKRVKYLNNRDLLAQIHASKNTYCSYVTQEDSQYDLIVPNLKKINAFRDGDLISLNSDFELFGPVAKQKSKIYIACEELFNKT